jgi:inhibitor of KinA
MYERAKILRAGDLAIVVELGDTIDPEINRRVHDLVRVIDARPVAGIVDLVPSYRSLLVYYDPLQTTSGALEQELLAIEGGLVDTQRPPARVVEIPTAYGGEFGPDLGFVAEHAKLSVEEVIRIHSGAEYLVFMMGFTAGFPYLGGMSASIATPRLQTPRTRVPAGSVGIAQQQTGIYPTDSPGGWQLIGRSPVRLFNEHRDPPVAIAAGDYVRFVPVSDETYRRVEREVQSDTYTLAVRTKR